jgi:hypothetical protein
MARPCVIPGHLARGDLSWHAAVDKVDKTKTARDGLLVKLPLSLCIALCATMFVDL